MRIPVRTLTGLMCAVLLVGSACAPGAGAQAEPDEPPPGLEPQIYEMREWKWSEISPGPRPSKALVTTVWTGREMIIWGGEVFAGGVRNVHGYAYNPALETWNRLPPAPLGDRMMHEAVWTGREMVIWGGTTGWLPPFGEPAWDGAAYDPGERVWRSLPDIPLSPRTFPAHAWTGTEFIVLGGAEASTGTPLYDGAAYNPATDRWRIMPPVPGSPAAAGIGLGTTLLWAGDRLLLWTRIPPATGLGPVVTELAAYDPREDAWELVGSGENVPAGESTPLWTGSEVLVQPAPPPDELFSCPPAGGPSPSTEGGRYDVDRNIWSPVKQSRYHGGGLWTGQVLVGFAELRAQFRAPCPLGHGGPGAMGESRLTPPAYEEPQPPERIWAAWSPTSEDWVALPYPPPSSGSFSGPMVWTGREFLGPNQRFGP